MTDDGGLDDPVIERPITWPSSPDGEAPPPEPDRSPAPDGPASLIRRIVTWAGVGLAVAAVGGVVAFWSLASHPGTDLGPVDRSMTCLERTEPTVTDLAIGGVALDPRTTAEITSVRLVDSSNMALAESSLLTIVPAPDGSTTLPGDSLGWPVPSDLRAKATVNWASDQSPLGAVLASGDRRALLLHVSVSNPADPAAFHAIAVAYQVGGASREETFPMSLLIPGGTGSCPAEATPAG